MSGDAQEPGAAAPGGDAGADAPAREDAGSVALGAAAHEFKNALGPLAMTLQLVERQLLAGQPIAPGDVAFARAQVRRLGQLCADLMDLTRADLGAIEIKRYAADLAIVVGEAVAIFRRGRGEVSDAPAAPERLPLDDLVPPPEPVIVSIDDARIHQVLLNLLENAARYGAPGAPIDVTLTRVDGDFARVSVADKGPGIAPAEQARIFERFVRGATSDGTRGLGLGLYLCRMIIERHGGRIGVDSEPGQGATFWFELPLEL